MANASDPQDNDAASAAGETSLDAAVKRLNDAIDQLEKTAQSAEPTDRDKEMQRMADDRTRLGRDLDDAEARAARLKDINSDVSRRLVKAMEMVRGVIENKG